MQDQKLMDYFEFDETDLEANRNGQFTEKQKARFASEAKSISGEWRVNVVLTVILGLIGLFVALWSFRNVIGISCGIIWALVFIGLAVRWFVVSNSKHQFQLKKAQGRINIVRQEIHGEHGHTSEYHELHVGGQEFDVDEDLADIMMQGDEYAVYYYYIDKNDFDGKVLSAEFISKAK